MAGENLERRVQKNGTCSPREAIDFIRQAAEGLAHAATSGVTHGDLKPANLLVDEEGTLKVVNFGFARLVDGVPNSPRDSQEQDTLAGAEYCAPEALNHDEGDLGPAADMYSLGQTLYYLLTGVAPPTPAASSADRAAALLSKQRGIDPHVASVYARLAAPVAGDRPAGWSDVLALLQSLNLPASPVETAAPAAKPAPPKAVPPIKKKPRISKAVAISDSASDSNEGQVFTISDSSEAPNEPQPFAIDTGDGARGRSRSKSSEKNVAASEAATIAVSDPPAKEAAEAGEPAPKVAKGKKKLDPRFALGVMIGGGVLALLLPAGLLWAFFGGGAKKQIATTDKKTEAKTTLANPDNPEVEEEVNPEEQNPEEENPELDPTPPKVSPADPAPKPEDPSPKPEDPAPKPENSDPNPENPTPNPETPTVPPEPKPEPMPEPTPPMGKPFEGIPTLVALPAPPSDQTPVSPVTLGPVGLPADRTLYITLNGGENATRSQQTFTLQNANNKTDEKNWDIIMSRQGEPDLVVARLHRDPENLTFEWAAEAATQTAAACLTNCLLQLNAGSDQRFISLRAPLEIDPVVLDLEKGATFKFALENIPSAEHIRAELVGLDPAMFPNPTFKTEATGPTKGTFVWFGDTPANHNLGFKIEEKFKGRMIEVALSTFYRPNVESKEVARLTKKLMAGQQSFIKNELQKLTFAGPQIDKLPEAQRAPAKNLVEQQTKQYQEQLERTEKAVALAGGMHEKGIVHVRLLFETEGGKVLLAQTKGAPEPQAEAKPDAK